RRRRSDARAPASAPLDPPQENSPMKRAATPLIALLVGLAASAILTTSASAALRSPQVPVIGGGLQAYLISVGETINVHTDRDATPTWSPTTPGRPTYTIQFQSSPNPPTQQFGM